MKPNDLYAMRPEKVSNDLSVFFGFYFNHLPEVVGHFYGDSPTQTTERIEIRYYKDHCFDGRRIWRLCAAYLDGKPFMIMQNAGREGDDYYARFVTDPDIYKTAVAYVQSLVSPEVSKVIKDVVDPAVDIPSLTSFYNESLYTVGLRTY